MASVRHLEYKTSEFCSNQLCDKQAEDRQTDGCHHLKPFTTTCCGVLINGRGKPLIVVS